MLGKRATPCTLEEGESNNYSASQASGSVARSAPSKSDQASTLFGI